MQYLLRLFFCRFFEDGFQHFNCFVLFLFSNFCVTSLRISKLNHLFNLCLKVSGSHYYKPFSYLYFFVHIFPFRYSLLLRFIFNPIFLFVLTLLFFILNSKKHFPYCSFLYSKFNFNFIKFYVSLHKLLL